ncbi:hypothetical protein PYW08_002410 [Mythimna loreyi]|uniref:Uncharacterized protein n=1 Tax=Mythimna loreyi TaxID=667449 RepID=A0ACC2R4D6_9NEOP|nr:hypothetical protein PYW08_002410 [Mythimna loreyi]
MSDNDTSTENDSWTDFREYQRHMDYIICVLTLAALIYGLTSWCFLKKFRNYRNYVLLNAILSYFFHYFTFILMYSKKIRFDDYSEVIDYFTTVKNHWLLVISHMFYVDIVKVFNQNIKRRYLKASLFSWGLPVITSIISEYLLKMYVEYIWINVDNYYLTNNYVFGTIFYLEQIIPVTINTVLYIVTVISLCRSFNMSTHTGRNTCLRLYIATLIFLMSDVTLLSSYIMNMTKYSFNIYFIIAEYLLVYFNILLMVVFLIAVKGNRKAWYDFYVKWINQRSSAGQRDENIIMNERVIREPVERYRAVLDV